MTGEHIFILPDCGLGVSSPSAPTALAPPSGVEPASGLEQSRSSHDAKPVSSLADMLDCPRFLSCRCKTKCEEATNAPE